MAPTPKSSFQIWNEQTENKGITQYRGNPHTATDKIDELASKSISEPLKGTGLEKPADAIDKTTGWLDKKMAGWAGKKPEGGDKK